FRHKVWSNHWPNLLRIFLRSPYEYGHACPVPVVRWLCGPYRWPRWVRRRLRCVNIFLRPNETKIQSIGFQQNHFECWHLVLLKIPHSRKSHANLLTRLCPLFLSIVHWFHDCIRGVRSALKSHTRFPFLSTSLQTLHQCRPRSLVHVHFEHRHEDWAHFWFHFEPLPDKEMADKSPLFDFHLIQAIHSKCRSPSSHPWMYSCSFSNWRPQFFYA